MENTIVKIKLSDADYNIVIGSGLLLKSDKFMSSIVQSNKCCVVTDEEVSKYHLFKVMRSLSNAGYEVFSPIVLPQGEKTKSFQHLQTIIEGSLGYGLNKTSTIVALGGGVVGDITGFAASMIMRGINLIQVPTTLLSQVDSSVGGKTAINTEYGKDVVGSVYNPRLVLIDTDVLQTLPKRQMLAGYSEMVKYGLINNEKFFKWLDRNAQTMLDGDSWMLRHAVEVCCKTKAKIIKQDVNGENGISEILNLGHTFGDAIETFSNYDNSCLHGEAVSIGMLLAYEFSQDLGICPEADVELVRRHFEKVGMMTKPPFKITAKDMFELMMRDKKNVDDEMNLILTKGIGKSFICKDVDKKEVKAFLKKRFG